MKKQNRPPERLSQAGTARKRSSSSDVSESTEFEPLSAAEMRELKRRIADSRDPRRFVVASIFLPTLVLYYVVEENVYIMNQPEEATFFKSREIAEAVRRKLGKSLVILEARKTRSGKFRLVPGAVKNAVRESARNRRKTGA